MTSQDLQKSFDKMFVSSDPWDAPFRDGVDRVLLYPTDGSMLEAEQFSALRTAAGSVGERSAHLLCVAFENSPDWNRDYEALLTLDDFESYKYPPEPLAHNFVEHVILSPSGSWGVMTSDDDHALVGGSKAFVTAFLGQLPETTDEMLNAFLERWRGGTKIDWVPALVRHVYGAKAARFLGVDDGD